MKRNFLLILICFLSVGAAAQNTNSWIVYGKSYYKFAVGEDGLYRISQSQINALGLGNIPVQQFQMWRNGEEQVLYTSVASGTLGASDYIEFWGKKNDGKAEKKFYINPDYQMTDYYSLQTDTASYFLTVNTSGNNLRFVNTDNKTTTNTLSPEPYFMNTRGVYYHTKINPGFGIPTGDVYVYSSAYDQGEGWTSADITPARSQTSRITGTAVYAAGPPITVNFGLAGNAYNAHLASIKINNQEIATPTFSYLRQFKGVVTNLPTSIMTTASTNISIENKSTINTDRISATHVEITYPSRWDFNNQTDFYFELPATSVGNYLEITNFNTGGAAPILMDFSSGNRYVGDISTSGKIKFALPPSSISVRKFRLVNMGVSLVKTVGQIKKVDFINYGNSANQGDYLIISNSALYTSKSGVNNVEEYRAYRSSAAGGSYKAVVIDIDQLVDQFAYGIKKHPGAIKDFVAYAKNNFSIMPKYVFLVGRGVTYDEYTIRQSSTFADRLNLVPTFGSPASDVLLTAPYGSSVPTFPTGRISVVNGEELGNYLDKIKEYEAAQKSTSQTLDSKLWMKNVVQIVGGSDESESQEFQYYMNGYKKILADTLYGAHVEMFTKTSNAYVQLLSSQRIDQLFSEGIGILSYFGHSSANTLEFNLSDPYSYNNPGKYPVFQVSGCTAGNNYVYDTLRILQNNYTISENFVLAKQRGSIAFIASTHFGIPNYLDPYNIKFYKEAASLNYQGSVGQFIQSTIKKSGGDVIDNDFYTRADYEENNLHGDPAIRINPHPLPDFVVEDQLIKINPPFISISEEKIAIDAKTYNIGKAVNDSIYFNIKRIYPDGNSEVLINKKIKAPNYADSIHLSVPIIGTRDKGLNKLVVTIDATQAVEEMSESNNSITKEFYIYEDEARPAFPYNYAIVNNNKQKLYASTADISSAAKDYVVEIDTTQLFNSSFKKQLTQNSSGGLLEFDPSFTYQDNTVYYWRVGIKPQSGAIEDFHWNGSSFIYLSNSTPGAGQFHYYQHLASDTQGVALTPTRTWKYGDVTNIIESRNGVFPSAASAASDFQVSVNGSEFVSSVCGVSGIIFSVLNPKTLKPWYNTYAGRFGSDPVCGEQRLANFQFNILDINKRKAAMNFLRDSVPADYIVVVRNISGTNAATNTYAADWMADTTTFGSGNSLYHALKEQGFNTIDSFNRPRAFIFMYQKNNPSFDPDSKFSLGISDRIMLDHLFISSDSIGYVQSPKFGPALEWKQMRWNGTTQEQNSGDKASVQIVGSDNTGTETVLFTIDRSQNVMDISAVDAKKYPFIQLKMRNADSLALTPYQLTNWSLNFTPAPEGALHPKLLYTGKDTLQQGEPMHFGIAFKNISWSAFDSIRVKMTIRDTNNVTRNIQMPMLKPLVAGDTIMFKYDIDTRGLAGSNTLYFDFNPDNAQPEQYHFNNFLYKKFYVHADVFNPNLDVTFDGVHILNQDIVSAKPNILIKLKDDNQYVPMNDTSMFKVQIRFPDQSLHDYHFDNDTMTFIPADLTKGENVATIELKPTLFGNDDEYELIVSGKDANGNRAGELAYNINFRVIDKPMISNLLNYPNPFTTSTAFVFTVTGSEVPQNIRIQILTVTGKVIKEITSEELGPIHIGRNITEYKWDGTDMYGQKVANGVYIYRVLTNLNGKSLDKYRSAQDDTDKYFIKGYGKMYFMR